MHTQGTQPGGSVLDVKIRRSGVGGGGGSGRRNRCVPTADSRWCMAETNTTL